MNDNDAIKVQYNIVILEELLIDIRNSSNNSYENDKIHNLLNELRQFRKYVDEEY